MTQNLKPKIIVMGNKNLAVMCLDYLLKQKENVIGVICNHDDNPKIKSWYLSLKAFCLKNNLKHRQPKTCDSPSFVQKIKKIKPDLIFSLIPEL